MAEVKQLTNAEILAESQSIAAELRRTGVKASAYAKNPIGSKDVFSIALNQQNELRIWAGTAKITVIPSLSGLKQAVLQVQEKARTITTVWKANYGFWSDWHSYTLEALQEQINNTRRTYYIHNNLGVQLPEGAEYSITAVDLKSAAFSYDDNFGTVTFQGKSKATSQSFLVGRDEKSQFISALPRKATSVPDAHDALRPAGVSRKALRQGEWFFVPATNVEKAAINATIKNKGSLGLYGRKGGWPHSIDRSEIGALENGSSHRASAQIRVGGKLYAVGLVHDTRPDRHGSIILPDWHRVIRNREVVNPTLSVASSRPASTEVRTLKPNPVGDVIAETLEADGLSQADLVRATGYSAKHINLLIKGRVRLTPEVALSLEEALGHYPAEFWCELQTFWDLWHLREATL